MNIIQVISANLRSAPATLRFPERVETTAGYRGLVRMAPELCVGCATCAYVCVSSAITLEEFAAVYQWSYDPDRCTFCGRCVEVCPTQALEMEAERPPVYMKAGELRAVHRLQYPRCPQCGEVAKPVNEAVLRRAFDEVSDEVRLWSRLCLRCRGRYFLPVKAAASALERAAP